MSAFAICVVLGLLGDGAGGGEEGFYLIDDRA